MSYEIERHSRDGVVVLAPRGRLVLGEPVEALRSTIEQLTAESQTRIAVDLTEVPYIDSSALGALVFSFTRIKAAGGAMALFGLNSRTTELLVITKLATVFPLADNELDAVNLCYPNRQANHFDILDFVEHNREKSGSE